MSAIPKTLTGIKDVDLKIISELDDYELGKVCSVNKYVHSLCKDENFWRNRTINLFITSEHVFKNVEKLNKFKGDRTWKNYYSYLLKYANSVIRGGADHFTKPRTKDLLLILQTFISNGDKLVILLDSNKYKELDEFLNNHLFVSPAHSYIYIYANEEQILYLLNRSRFDKRFDPNNPKIFIPLLQSHGDSYKFLLKYIDINFMLEIILSSPGTRAYLDKIRVLLNDPRITLQTLWKLKNNPRVSPKLLPDINLLYIQKTQNK
jgi:hypothetical protein